MKIYSNISVLQSGGQILVPSLVVVLVGVPFPSDGISVDVNSHSSSSPATSSLSAFTLCLSPAVGYWLLHQVLSELVKLMEEGQILGEQGESFEKRHHIERHHMDGQERFERTQKMEGQSLLLCRVDYTR